MVADAESTRGARKPVEVSRLLIVNGRTPPHNFIDVSLIYTGEMPLSAGPGSRGEG